MMAAYAEGFNILRHANVGAHEQAADAETTPLREPDAYRYDLDLADIAEVWRRGSVIASWLLDLTAHALLQDPDLSGFQGRVSDSGEGRWTVKAAIDEGVPAPVISAALYERFASRGDADFAGKILSAMREEFGGHVEKPATEPGVHPPTVRDDGDAFRCAGAVRRDAATSPTRRSFPRSTRMCQRGRLDVPIVGVAKSGWTLDDLKEHARDAVRDGRRLRRKGVRAACRPAPLCRRRLPRRRDLPAVAHRARRTAGDRCTTSRSRRACFRRSSRVWRNRAPRRARASSSRSRSVAT